MGLRHLFHLNVGTLQVREEKGRVYSESGNYKVLAQCQSPYTALKGRSYHSPLWMTKMNLTEVEQKRLGPGW